MSDGTTLIPAIRLTSSKGAATATPERWELDIATYEALDESIGRQRPAVFLVEGRIRTPRRRNKPEAQARIQAPRATRSSSFDRLVELSAVDNHGDTADTAWRAPFKFFLHIQEGENIKALDAEYGSSARVLNGCTSLLRRALGEELIPDVPTQAHWKKNAYVLGISPTLFKRVAEQCAPTEPVDDAVLAAAFGAPLPVDERLQSACPGRSPAIKALHQLALRVAPETFPVLISGDNGVGKRRLAMAIHALGKGPKAPFERFDCDGYLRARDLENELFGVAGPRSPSPGVLARAAGGTLYVANVDQLPRPLQVRLRNAIHDRQYRRRRDERWHDLDARLLMSSSADLAALVEADRFDALLYYVLRACPLEIPSLSERPEDVGAIIDVLWPTVTGTPGKLSRSVVDELRDQRYRGNLRELRALLYAIFRFVGAKPTPSQVRFVLRAGRIPAGEA